MPFVDQADYKVLIQAPSADPKIFPANASLSGGLYLGVARYPGP